MGRERGPVNVRRQSREHRLVALHEQGVGRAPRVENDAIRDREARCFHSFHEVRAEHSPAAEIVTHDMRTPEAQMLDELTKDPREAAQTHLLALVHVRGAVSLQVETMEAVAPLESADHATPDHRARGCAMHQDDVGTLAFNI
jgi:hypothetical protein